MVLFIILAFGFGFLMGLMYAKLNWKRVKDLDDSYWTASQDDDIHEEEYWDL